MEKYLSGVNYIDVKLSNSRNPNAREIDRLQMENSFPEKDFKYI